MKRIQLNVIKNNADQFHISSNNNDDNIHIVVKNDRVKKNKKWPKKDPLEMSQKVVLLQKLIQILKKHLKLNKKNSKKPPKRKFLKFVTIIKNRRKKLKIPITRNVGICRVNHSRIGVRAQGVID